MTQLSPRELRASGEATALVLVLQHLVRELATLDATLPERLEQTVRASFSESRKAIGETERNPFVSAAEDTIDTVFIAPKT